MTGFQNPISISDMEPKKKSKHGDSEAMFFQGTAPKTYFTERKQTGGNKENTSCISLLIQVKVNRF